MDQPFSAPEHFLASDAAGVAGDFILKCGFKVWVRLYRRCVKRDQRTRE